MKRFLTFFALAALMAAACTPQQKRDYLVCAYVWPSCHDDSLAHEWLWADGEGEWEVIKKGDPRFEGHYQPKRPLWGYGLDDDPQVVEQWIQTALKYGVNTFVYDWYWYNAPDGYHGPYLEDALNNGFLKAPSNGKMNFFLMYGFFKNISSTYAEAARVDGAGHLMVFFKIMLPLALPVIVSLSVIYAIGIWNDYTTPSIYMKSMPPLAYGLFLVRETLTGKGAYTQTFAAMMIALVPILAVFIAFSNTIMENTIAGGLKG